MILTQDHVDSGVDVFGFAHEVKRLRAENALLRVRLSEFGITVPVDAGALSLERIRAYEAVRFWAHRYRRAHDPLDGSRLDAAIVQAERPI